MFSESLGTFFSSKEEKTLNMSSKTTDLILILKNPYWQLPISY